MSYAKRQEKKTFSPMQVAKNEAAIVLQNAARGRNARKELIKRADEKEIDLEDRYYDAVKARMKANIALLDKQIKLTGSSRIAIRKGVLAEKIEKPIIWGKMVIEIPSHMYYQKNQNFTQKLDEQIINNGKIMSLKGVPAIKIRTADIDAPRIVSDGSIPSIAREKELNRQVKQYEKKGREIITAKTNSATAIQNAFRMKLARKKLAALASQK